MGAMEQLEEELTCPVCCGLFEDPRVLLCSHSFCKKCLEGLMEGHRGPASRAPLKCPTCRKESPHNGAGSLQINYSLRGIVEKFSKIKVLPKTSVCARHREQPLNIFCATDLKLICGFCATTGEHRGHAFSSLEDAYEREKAAFGELLRGVEGWRSADALSSLETLQAAKKSALQAVGRDAEKVADYFDRLVAALEGKRSEISSDFETLRLVVMQAYDPEITRLSAALEEQKRALSLAESVRGVSDPLCFLQRMQEFRERLQVLKETPPSSGREARACAFVCDFDVQQWDSLRLCEVDKISVPHESGSYRTGGPRPAAPKRLARWLVPFLLLALFLLLLLSTNFVSDLASMIEAFHEADPSRFRKLTDACLRLIEWPEAGGVAQ
ncbi:unnamed protein product [Menidia menidia]|uniref:(Atlantic silverside) hypothetical protein n=1 Tax=Menidia menidia TaxID=238744 RepID=A0A8S4AFX6_9TELE|nr:unnamed protein product [Menidia menidia]